MAFFQKSCGTGVYHRDTRAGFRGVARKLKHDQRGSIVVITALVIPVVVMSAGMGVEISHWTVVKLQLQRTADIAALAGATEYALTSNANNAANAAASVAELNGAAGSTARTWNASTKLLSDNQTTAQVTAGVRQNSDTALKVTVSQTVPLLLTRIMSSSRSVTVSATGWAEFRTRVQPCVLALSSGGTGITAQGNPDVRLTRCSIRSNASISTGGSATMSASAFYANGSITGSVAGGPLHPNAGTIPDPYLAHSGVQTALGSLASRSGLKFEDKPNDEQTLSPGTWSMWDIKGTVQLKSGIYYVKGNISLGAQAVLEGLTVAGVTAAVTIVTSGTLKMQGGSSMTLAAALAPPNPGDPIPGGAIPGVVFAGNSASPSSFHGNTSPALTGLVYYPNGALEFGGTAQGGNTGCLEVIAASVAMKGNSALASNCARYGTVPFSSGGPAAVALVQ